MRNIVLAVFIFISFSAQAHHHRAHALYFMERFNAQIELTRGHFTAFVGLNQDVFTPEDEQTIEQIVSRMDYVEWQASLVEQGLEDCNVDLMGLRREVNQPSSSGPGSMPHSVLKQIKNMLYAMGKLENISSNARHIRAASASWELMDNVLWHVNDAIKEEVYEDDPNIGHDPGVDPITFLANPSSRPPQEAHTEERHQVICN